MVQTRRPFRTILPATLLALAMPFGAAAQTQPDPPPPPGTPAAEALKRHEEMTVLQALDRLRQAEKNIGEAIAALQDPAGQPKQDGAAAAPQAAPAAGDPNRPAAIQQAEQALHDVRRAIDEINVREDRRQRVLDRLDDADSAMRMARQPDAQQEKQRLARALEAVQQEVKLAQQALPAPQEGK